MAQDERREERLSDRRGRKPPAGSFRAFLFAVVAVQALGPHGVHADLDVTLTVTNYRFGVLHSCGPPGANHATPPEEDCAVRPETKR